MADELKIKGRIDIDADEDGLLAVLHFMPDDNGTEYDRQAVNRLIADKKIVYGIRKPELDKKLDSLFSAGAESTITVAEGTAAENAAAAEYEWVPSVIPDDKKRDIERVLKNASPPEIFKIEIEKIKREKTVKKKGKLPFGKEKDEKVVEVVKNEKKTRIDVVPDVIDAGWVEPGGKIAAVKQAIVAKPGKDVFGKPVMPPVSDEEFWIGRGIESKAGGLVSTESGILRRGRNWVEVLPFKSHDWELELSKDKNTCLLNFNPGGPESEPPNPAEILRRAQMLGCAPETLFPEAQLDEIINRSISSKRNLSNAVISTDDDGFFEIKVSDDKMKAEMDMHKGRGNGKPLVLKQAGAAIKASGLKGLDFKKIQETILDFYRGPDTDIIFPLAEGSPAEDGDAGELVYDLELMNDAAAEEIKKRIPNLNDEYLKNIESSADFPPAGATAFAAVQENQQFAGMEISDGKKGSDVYGKEVSSTAADLTRYEALDNVKIDGGKFVSTAAGLLERFEKDGITSFRVRPHADSELKIQLSADKMSARLTADPAIGTGAPPSLEEVNRQLSEAGVTNGIDNEAIREAVEKCRGGETVVSALVASGKPPVNAGESEFKFLIDLAGGEAVSIDEKGRANYRKQNKLSSVSEGDRLVEIKAARDESEDGWDVTGKVLSAQKTAPLNLEVGANVGEEQDDEGNTILVAGKSGRLIYEKNKLEIQENLFIKGDVDFATGNIKFGGDVNVKGNVKSGFFVMAGGNIAVGMNSEMSLLSSEKSIMVGQGIKGGGKGMLRAKDSIQISFAERATLLAVNAITVKNAVFGCKVKCNGRLRLVSEKGYLVGGRIQAREGIEAANIGSISGSRTEISFGQDYLISDKIETEEKEINKIKHRLVKIDPEMREAEKTADTKKLTTLRMEKVKLMKIMEKRSLRVFTLKERFEQHYPGEVLIRGEVFPGAVFESHGRYLEITEKAKSLKIIFNQETGVLEKVPLENTNE